MSPTVALVILACLGGGCHEFRLPTPATALTCTIFGEIQVAQWKAQNPDYEVQRWHCEDGSKT